MSEQICAVAVEAAAYSIDRVYDYRLPDELSYAKVGCRVLVPFGRGNKRVEGIILAFREKAGFMALKQIEEVLDKEPLLDEKQIRLAIWMRERLYCTFYDCIRIMLPTGLWFHRNDTYTLCVPYDETQKYQKYHSILSCFSKDKTVTLKELQQTLHHQSIMMKLDELCNMGVLKYDSKIATRVKDKTTQMYRLAMDINSAISRAKRSAVRQDVITVLSDGSCMSKEELQYMTGITPAALRDMTLKGILERTYEEQFRTPDYDLVESKPQNPLTEEQQAAYEGIISLYETNEPNTALLYGVTGSGKTQVYLHLIQKVRDDGGSAIILVPEIGLTPQFIRVFTARFGSDVAVLHSALSNGERYDSWKKIKAGLCKIIIGTRSAVFAPVNDLKLIIIDEEQDAAYQSEQLPRYHARDIALYRAWQNKSLLVLGSATPSVESYYQAEEGKYKLFTIKNRYGAGGLPEVLLADMRGLAKEGWVNPIGPILKDALTQNLKDGKQSILFINRRGDSRMVGCTMCGWVPECTSCSTTMTYHSANGRAMCHYCGASQKIGRTCPSCGSDRLFLETPGTQRIVKELENMFPHAKIMRMDADTTMTKNSHEELFKQFGNGEADILVGTQMVTKGLDFENVTLVGVLEADQGLYAQDFRALERTFSLITQVVGRAGRRSTTGKAVIQTHYPDNPVLIDAARQDYEAFYQREIERRKATNTPPQSDMLVLCCSGEQEKAVLDAMLRLKARITSLMNGQFADFNYPVLGPAAASVVRVAGRYRYHLTIRCPENSRRRQLISGVMKEFAKDTKNKGVSIYAQLNPDSM